MDRKGFLGSLVALIVAPKAVKAMKFDKLIAADSIPFIPMEITSVPRSVEKVYFIAPRERRSPARLGEIPTTELELRSAVGYTRCSICKKRYDQHPPYSAVMSDGRPNPLRHICEYNPFIP